jgi:hypothetical protein
VWWYRPVIPALGWPRWEDHDFKANLGYTVSPAKKEKETTKQNSNKN